MSCTQDRELRVASLTDRKSVKLYDLGSFTNENITALKMLSQDRLLLGSKDTNIYLIDIVRGKLEIVYEGHWSRVNLIYILPGA